ncbi:MAG: (E)-4-hydroxy-3-methylbut-2-enyl-diphosphate synthase [Acidobacteriota bacterium]|nr:(E)-4-hydroxy-3-methylbut-2-enyl-diphosphate synthase [Acidobacteriota bacterium]MDH3784114.1 (E)-4-hydroxy-3-methylbut-2-enyl-diphosphate synthase [Acidobacteriota bacterium]
MRPWTYNGIRPYRRKTRRVAIGDLAIGGHEPIRVQSMTTPSTRDTTATVDQIERLVDAGCEIVRVTVPTTGDADNLPNIRAEMKRRQIRVPLVADIHFTPAAAMKAVEHVEKIRINPGNYADKKKFASREYTDVEYDGELKRIERVVTPLIKRAKTLGVSMRIGTNHGSLSDRIMNRYGDTPGGMVESALEFVRICEKHDYRDLVLSMKSSNPVVVQHVYRLLASRMSAEQMDYPFHLGVTEAGDGEDGRIKSAIGIGALLAEGLGDTVRVSLTEDPVAEIPVARELVANSARHLGELKQPTDPWPELRDPHRYDRRVAEPVTCGALRIGGGETVAVETPLVQVLSEPKAIRSELDSQIGVRVPEETRADVIVIDAFESGDDQRLLELRQALHNVAPRVALSARVKTDAALDTTDRWWAATDRLQVECDVNSVDTIRELLDSAAGADRLLLVELRATQDTADPLRQVVQTALACIDGLNAAPLRHVQFGLVPDPRISTLHGYRLLSAALTHAGAPIPLVLIDRDDRLDTASLLKTATQLGGLLCDGTGDSIQVRRSDATESRRVAFGVLQAARVRITRTEFISCPSCGRTLFDLEETTARIKERTSHLKGLKIAVMGCIVNGPGEMADADFGYVGWGEDKIALFVGKEMVARDIPTKGAEERLVQLIKDHGRWVDPPVAVSQD